jgi:WD40 repeat protein
MMMSDKDAQDGVQWKDVCMRKSQSFQPSTNDSTLLAMSPCGNRIVTNSALYTRSLDVWNISRDTFDPFLEARFAKYRHGPLKCISWSPDSRWITTSGTTSNDIGLWDYKHIYKSKPREQRCAGVAATFEISYSSLFSGSDFSHNCRCRLVWSPDSKVLAIAEKFSVVLYDVESQSIQKKVTWYDPPVPIEDMRWLRQDSSIALCSTNKDVIFYNVESGEKKIHTRPDRDPFIIGDWVCNFMEMSTDAQMLAVTASTDGQAHLRNVLRVWDIGRSCVHFEKVFPVETKINLLSWSPTDARMLAIALSDFTVRLFNVSSCKPGPVFTLWWRVNCIAWAADGSRFSILMYPHYVHVFDVHTWSDRTHHMFPPLARQTILKLMCIVCRLNDDGDAQRLFALPKLPMHIWLQIFGCLMAIS